MATWEDRTGSGKSSSGEKSSFRSELRNPAEQDKASGVLHGCDRDFNCALTDLPRTRAVCTPTKGPGDGTGKTVHFSCPTRLQRAGRTPLEGVLEASTQSGLSLCECHDCAWRGSGRRLARTPTHRYEPTREAAMAATQNALGDHGQILRAS